MIDLIHFFDDFCPFLMEFNNLFIVLLAIIIDFWSNLIQFHSKLDEFNQKLVQIDLKSTWPFNQSLISTSDL